jgi:hypothetical protein
LTASLPALTLVLTFRPLAFDFALLLFLAADFGLFTIGSHWKMSLCSIQVRRWKASHRLPVILPALTLDLTLRLLAFDFRVLLFFDLDLFMIGSSWVGFPHVLSRAARQQWGRYSHSTSVWRSRMSISPASDLVSQGLAPIVGDFASPDLGSDFQAPGVRLSAPAFPGG